MGVEQADVTTPEIVYPWLAVTVNSIGALAFPFAVTTTCT